MRDDEAPRTGPACAPRGHLGWLRRWRRGSGNAATSDYDFARGRRGWAEERGSAGVAGERSVVRPGALVEPRACPGDTLNPRPRSGHSPELRGGSPETWHSCPDTHEQTGDHFDRARSLVHEGNGGGAKHSASTALPCWKADWSGDQARRTSERPATATRFLQPLRRLESAHRGLTRAGLGLLTAGVWLSLATSAAADTRKPPRDPAPPTITIGRYSQQDDRSRASIGASIRAKESAPGRRAAVSRQTSSAAGTPAKGGAGADLPTPYPPLRADSAFALNPEPLGPGSFWYTLGPGRVCPYAGGTLAPCYTLVGPGAPGVDPGVLAASVADRLPLFPGRIQTSPQRAGLTGARSWFWLDPAPSVEELTVTVAGETVTVTAEPSVIQWRFGDGAGLAGGPGRPYRPGPPPDGAIVHVYETRCLPGDQGRNPYVLASCGSSGYPLEAVVGWRISYSASGPIDASGTLPTRTTAADAPYAVTESRGFLVPGASK